MRVAKISVAVAAFLVLIGPAFGLESSVTTTSSISPEALWKKIGDFCGVADWHPAIEKCVLSADGKQRTLSLKGGGTIVEALENLDDAGHAYTYTIISGPLPVANYLARSEGLLLEMGRHIRRQGRLRRRCQESHRRHLRVRRKIVGRRLNEGARSPGSARRVSQAG